jgi:hypothetical protein
MKNVVILDLDGVLITTPPWRQDEMCEDNYARFKSDAVNNLNVLLNEADAELWLISGRRKRKSLEEFNIIFKARNISKELSGMVPVYFEYIPRIEEFKDFINDESIKNFLLIDDDTSLDGLEEDLKNFWVKTHPMIGFSKEKLEEALQKIKYWKS